MAPLTKIFPASSLPQHVQTDNKGFKQKRRKGDAVDLRACALLEIVQFSCNPPDEGVPEQGVIKCMPVVRLFRRWDLSSY